MFKNIIKIKDNLYEIQTNFMLENNDLIDIYVEINKEKNQVIISEEEQLIEKDLYDKIIEYKKGINLIKNFFDLEMVFLDYTGYFLKEIEVDNKNIDIKNLIEKNSVKMRILNVIFAILKVENLNKVIKDLKNKLENLKVGKIIDNSHLPILSLEKDKKGNLYLSYLIDWDDMKKLEKRLVIRTKKEEIKEIKENLEKIKELLMKKPQVFFGRI